ncbi:amidohydrolase family protein [Paenirhodobacter enshiensis]|uniref:amidohydrolase family protein n=1 Tax=Paenirhodobacter enshiensis TaxID=1105367 RepID=UPI0035AD9169
MDLILRNVRIGHQGTVTDIALDAGRIAAIGPGLSLPATAEHDGEGLFACAGFSDSHVHLDKACILDRCTIHDGTLSEAIRETARAKAGFTEADVHTRARSVIERAISHGTMRMRSFVEVDPRAGLRSLTALLRLREEYRFALDLQLCAFAQEGLTQEPETLTLLRQALEMGADLVGGCPYADPDPVAHVKAIFDLAQAFDVDADFHLDFDLDPAHTDLPAVLRETEARGWGGRVTIGHVTNLSAMGPERLAEVAADLARAGIAVTALPATDLFLNGRGADRLVPRGVAPVHRLHQAGVRTALATNNVMNPFTPYGDASLLRMANLYANVAQLSRPEDLAAAFAMVSDGAAAAMGMSAGLTTGAPADIVLIEAASPADAIARVGRVRCGWKRGRMSFDNGRSRIFAPDAATP